MQDPVIAVTMGDAAGVGPELIVKACANGELRSIGNVLLVGDQAAFERAAAVSGVTLRLRPIQSPGQATFEPDQVDLLIPPDVEFERLPAFGGLDATSAANAARCVRAAYEFVARGEVGAVVSAPVNKAGLHAAGYLYSDEVSYLSAETGSPEPVLIGIVKDLCTVSVTLHVPLRAVPELLTADRILRHIDVLAETVAALGRRPRLAIAALNPHAGEGGLLGRDEIDVLGPTAEVARARGLDLLGPLPADTIFVRAFRGEFNGVVCLYHDQANIARKLFGWDGGASVFLGLPAVFATTAHGTAYDIAGTGVADPASLICAARAAAALLRARRGQNPGGVGPPRDHSTAASTSESRLASRPFSGPVPTRTTTRSAEGTT